MIRRLKKWKIISFGLGPIGASIARVALSRGSRLEVVGAVDSDARLVGKDLAEVAGLKKSTGIKVRPNANDLYKEADVVLHATNSYLSTTRSQLLEFCRGRVDVVSTCEELSYPWFSHKEMAIELDRAAKKNGVTLLGTGVNPGFVMDALAVTLSGACEHVSKIEATRILDATKRRVPFQTKVGVGLSIEEFRKKVRSGKFGHIGLQESIAMACTALNFKLDRISQKISPKIATHDISTEHFGVVKKGRVIGLVQDAQGFANNRVVASYHIEMYAEAKNPMDEIRLSGNPDIVLKVPGGTPGDITTAAIVVNSIPRVVESNPGLVTVKDLKPASGVSSP